jgi:hypothetical protein
VFNPQKYRPLTVKGEYALNGVLVKIPICREDFLAREIAAALANVKPGEMSGGAMAGAKRMRELLSFHFHITSVIYDSAPG